jgi:ketosteroid isomerase-like protein
MRPISLLIIGSLLFIACDQALETKESIKKSQIEQETIQVIKKLQKAMNEHNLDAMLECVDVDYVSEQPFYPDRNFTGREHMQENWTWILKNCPDFVSSLKRYSVSNDTIWAEWHWYGTNEDSSKFNMLGVTIFKVEGGRITNGRLFMESVE